MGVYVSLCACLIVLACGCVCCAVFSVGAFCLCVGALGVGFGVVCFDWRCVFAFACVLCCVSMYVFVCV